MNGAEALLGSLAASGIEICFMNPGTTEIHLVEALDRVARLRGVGCLFEGVASGAADGYARMTGKPASTLFHLGPGLSNALANLHNACRARVAMVNIVGDHATFHRPFDPPLAADIEAIARPYSQWLKTSRIAGTVGLEGAEAVAAARAAPGRIATLIVPSDVAWGDGGTIAAAVPALVPAVPAPSRIEEAARLLRDGAQTAILLGSHTTQGRALVAAGRIAAATGARLLAPFAFAGMERGAGRPNVERVPYITDQALALLAEFRQLILVGAAEPVAFFGHPSRPSRLMAEGCRIIELATPEEDCAGALAALVDALDASRTAPQLQRAGLLHLPQGQITLEGIARAVAAVIPENGIVVDESITSGRGMMAATRGAAPHDYLVNTGGSIGIGVPLAVGAAIAAPDRPVLCLEGDGSFMYTLQALWTAARENLAITTVIFSNRTYQILKTELAALGTNPGPRAEAALDIAPPAIDIVPLSKSLGVPAVRVTNLEEFAAAMRRGLASRAPNLIEVPV